MVMLIRDMLSHLNKDKLRSTKDSNKLPKYTDLMLNIYLLLHRPKDLTLVVPLSLSTHLTQHPLKYHMHHHKVLIPDHQ